VAEAGEIQGKCELEKCGSHYVESRKAEFRTACCVSVERDESIGQHVLGIRGSGCRIYDGRFFIIVLSSCRQMAG
jgi:hypothetical protein